MANGLHIQLLLMSLESSNKGHTPRGRAQHTQHRRGALDTGPQAPRRETSPRSAANVHYVTCRYTER